MKALTESGQTSMSNPGHTQVRFPSNVCRSAPREESAQVIWNDVPHAFEVRFAYPVSSKSTVHEHLSVACRLCPKSEVAGVCRPSGVILASR